MTRETARMEVLLELNVADCMQKTKYKRINVKVKKRHPDADCPSVPLRTAAARRDSYHLLSWCLLQREGECRVCCEERRGRGRGAGLTWHCLEP